MTSIPIPSSSSSAVNVDNINVNKNTRLLQNWTQFYEAVAIGSFRGLLRFPLEQPLDRVKTSCQAFNANQPVSAHISPTQITKQIIQREGWKGFYAGGTPNSLRMTVREVYRWPLVLLSPPLVANVFNVKEPPHQKIATGFIVASVESLVVCPMERVKVLLMTQQDSNVKSILSHFKSNLSSLMAGVPVLYARQLVSWTSFMWADYTLRKAWSDRVQRRLSSFELFTCAVAVGGLTTLCVMPFDTLKTQIQKLNPEQAQQNTFQLFRQILRSAGIRGLYAGGSVRFAQYCVSSILTVPILEFMEHRWMHNTIK